jgi:hypothetical protein
MKKLSFSLQPFRREEVAHDYRIAGEITRDLNRLVIMYKLSGPLGHLTIPPAGKPARKHGLWEETCFEFFLKLKDSDVYWEFNLSPSGCWNTYRFSAYRQGMQEEPALDCLPFSIKTLPDALLLTLEFDLKKIIPPDRMINIAVCAVIKDINAGTTFWARAHHGTRPDFHRLDKVMFEL